MTITYFSILLGSGLVAGLMNSVAGGGSFVTFPVLVFLGLSPVAANVASTVALVPGTFATMFVYRNELKIHNKKLPIFIFLSFVGGLVGALILLQISNQAFSKIVPYLILLATVLFTFKTGFLDSIKKISKSPSEQKDSVFYRWLMLFLFLIVAIYGGFFGAGLGILMLSLFSLMGMTKLNEMNALRSCCGLVANAAAMIIFCSSKVIFWPEVLVMSFGAIIGGYYGAGYVKKLPNEQIRNIVIIVGWIITAYFFWRM